MNSEHEEVREARSILRNFSTKTKRIASIISKLCDERDKLKATLKDVQAKAQEEIQSVKKAVEDTRQRQRDIVQKLEKTANLRAKQQFDQERQSMGTKIKKMQKKINELLDDKALSDARIQRVNEQASKWITANKSYEMEFPALIKENEALKYELNIARAAIDRINKAMADDTDLEAENRKLKKELALLKSLYKGVLKPSQFRF